MILYEIIISLILMCCLIYFIYMMNQDAKEHISNLNKINQSGKEDRKMLKDKTCNNIIEKILNRENAETSEEIEYFEMFQACEDCYEAGYKEGKKDE